MAALTHIHDMTDPAQFVPEEVADGIIKDVMHTSAVMRLARKRTQNTLELTYNRRTGGPAGYWVEDMARKKADKATWDQFHMWAKEIAVIIPVYERDLIGNPLDIWTEMKQDVIEGFAITFDSAALFGTDSPYNAYLLQYAQLGGNIVEEGGGEDLADDISLTMGQVEAHNYDPNGILSLKTLKARLRGLRTTDGAPIFQPALTQNSRDQIYGMDNSFYIDAASWDADVTGFVCDWNTVEYSIVQGITYKLLTEATLTTITDDAGVALSLAERDMVALRATMYIGFRPTKEDAVAALVTHAFYQGTGTPDTGIDTP